MGLPVENGDLSKPGAIRHLANSEEEVAMGRKLQVVVAVALIGLAVVCSAAISTVPQDPGQAVPTATQPSGRLVVRETPFIFDSFRVAPGFPTGVLCETVQLDHPVPAQIDVKLVVDSVGEPKIAGVYYTDSRSSRQPIYSCARRFDLLIPGTFFGPPAAQWLNERLLSYTCQWAGNLQNDRENNQVVCTRR